jgi:hypothetical protein
MWTLATSTLSSARTKQRYQVTKGPPETHQFYLKYKSAIDIEKKGGPKVDFGDINSIDKKSKDNLQIL